MTTVFDDAGTVEHVEPSVRGWRRVDRIAEAKQSTQRHRSRALHVYQDEDGAGDQAVLMKALGAAREALYRQTKNVSAGTLNDVAAEPPAFSQRQADA